jgi:hypothetical protein
MVCWWLEVLISRSLDSFHFNQIYHHVDPSWHPPAALGGILGSGHALLARKREVYAIFIRILVNITQFRVIEQFHFGKECFIILW